MLKEGQNSSEVLMVTTNEVPMKEIVEVIGLVHSVSVQTKSIFSDIGADLKSIIGGNLGKYEKMIETAKLEALTMLNSIAISKGANAVVGLKFSTTNTTAVGSAEIIAYGTAVVIR